MKVKYNAPVTITFALICTAIMALDLYLVPGLVERFFTAEGSLTFRMDSLASYVRVISHVFGHEGWDHLLNNMMLILLLGPILEEKYGSASLLWMIFITALINGLVNGIVFPTALMGSSGIAFMMILLVSFANIKWGEIPLTFFLVLVLYLLKEFLAIYRGDDISQISHIVGGACGAVFGFYKTVVIKKKKVPLEAPAPAGGTGGNITVVN
ncbi:MAG: rhomboid family intramembrane serine protease [Spirochaetales bacterium]|nr:rhomboid family intramembrane serine protease [Spirochaetales bacterium]